MSQNYIYHTSDNSNINITTFGNSNLLNGNCIIFVHGFKGFKDWGFGPYLSNYFAGKGYFVVTFNFSHNGVGKDSIDFNELDKFANNTYSREIKELTEIIEAYKAGFFGQISPNTKVGIIGHSRGGGISLVVSSLSPNVDALVTWSSISKFDRFTEHQKNEWKTKGYLEMLNSRTKQMMRLNKILLEDFEKNTDSLLNIEKSLKNLTIPYLIIHGDQDLAVPLNEAEQIYDWANKETTEFYRISGTGHTFDIKHPFEDSSVAFNKVLDKTNNFFYKSL